MWGDAESVNNDLEENLLLRISSDELPNDIQLTITHKRDFDANDETSQFNYSYLIYEFKNSQNDFVRARTYFDRPLKASLFFEKSDVDLSNLEATETGKLLKSSYLSLCALGYYAIDILGEDSYEALTMPQLSIDKTDVINWASKMDKLESNKNAH